MKRALRLSVIIIVLSCCSISACNAYWIWTPKLRQWINPKHAPKDTPRDQYDFAMQYFLAKDYPKAIGEFKKLNKFYPHSELAPDAQYYIGRSYEEIAKYYNAFLAYQKVIDTYPRTELTEEIIERQYKIGNLYFTGQKEKLFGIAIIPVIDKALEIFEKVRDNAPYGKHADLAQFKIGECYKKNGQYKEAVDAFQKLVYDYPKSLLLEQAKYEVAYSTYRMSLKPYYDQEPTEDAIKEFEEFIKDRDEGDTILEADKALVTLQEKKAESLYGTAYFYERAKQYESAAIYYQEIMEKYPNTSWAAKAFEKLSEVEKKMEKQKK
ncbi:MAG: outer membrane protein assembly factor BamD [Candidatus Omnitrophota bacterium]